jgi:hypothetical protein
MKKQRKGNLNTSSSLSFFIIINVGIQVSLCAPQLYNLTGPEINDHINL